MTVLKDEYINQEEATTHAYYRSNMPDDNLTPFQQKLLDAAEECIGFAWKKSNEKQLEAAKAVFIALVQRAEETNESVHARIWEDDLSNDK
jgi:hypothetical protein